MKLEGAQTIAADRATVWAALNDPAVLKACIPGCQELEKTSDTEFTATVKQKVGPVSATFNGVVHLENLNPPESYRIAGEGKGGAAGFAKGGADVSLQETPAGTVLTYDAEAKVGGKIAQLGARLINGFANKMAAQFFETFKAEVEGANPDQAERYAAAAPEPAAPAADPAAAAVAPAAAGAAQAAGPTAMAEAAAAPTAPAGDAPAAEKKGFWKRLFG